ncbi:hypothetical protein [Chryseobacterium sp. SIMBA_029]|uniref:hypothetical protein n=1 Tax=Chryseobacterium sp. SIMBA_029 TaxID=3085772 RepID=UPI00397A8A46
MKKFLTILGVAAFAFGYSQGGALVINNYTPHDFSGYIMANNFAGGCYPFVTSGDPGMVTVPANANMGNGNELKYGNYKDQYTSSLYPMTQWYVQTSSTSSMPRAWNHPAVMPGGTVSNNTKWASTKFKMNYAGTTNGVPGFSSGLTLAGNASCYTAPDYFDMTSGGITNSAEIFTLSSGGINYTYIQLYTF